MSYIFEHTRLGFCWWDLLALVILVIVVVAFADELEDQLSELYAEDSVEADKEL